jgi:hypothetical protein
MVKDRSRLWKEGVRDLVLELCWALHNVRVRLTPWQRWFNQDKLNCTMPALLDQRRAHAMEEPWPV